MSVTTLEEVFIRVANGTADEEDRNNLKSISIRRQSSQSSAIMGAEVENLLLDTQPLVVFQFVLSLGGGGGVLS